MNGESAGRRERPREVVRLRDVLAVREFRGIIIAQVASEAGDQIARVALALLVLGRTDSPLLAAATFAVTYVPTLIAGPFLSPLADRFSRRTLMLGADLGRALLVSVLALVSVPGAPLWLIFALLFVAEMFTPLFDAARYASIPDVLGNPGYVNAGMGFSRALNLVNQVVGLVLGGIVVQLAGARIALLIDAFSFLASFGVLAVTLKPRAATLDPTGSISVLLRDLREGWRLLMADPSRRAFVLLMWALAGPITAPEAVGLAYARDTGQTDGVGGVLMASVVLGAAVGSVLVGRRALRQQLDLILPLAIAMALPLLVTGIEPPIAILVVLWALAGGAQAFLVPVMSFTTLLTPNEQRGRVVGIAGAIFAALSALGYLVTGWIATSTSPAFAVVVMAVVGLVFVSAAYLVWPAARLRADVRALEASM